MDLPDRLHPNRLAEEDYHAPRAIVFVVWRARAGVTLNGETAQILLLTMGRMARKRNIRIEAYCVMPDHLHAVVSLDEDGDILGWIRYVKRETARQCASPGMWQRSYWDRHARRDEDAWAMVSYALDNPVRQGLVAEWHEWPYSWSAWHEGGQGPDINH